MCPLTLALLSWGHARRVSLGLWARDSTTKRQPCPCGRRLSLVCVCPREEILAASLVATAVSIRASDAITARTKIRVEKKALFTESTIEKEFPFFFDPFNLPLQPHPGRKCTRGEKRLSTLPDYDVGARARRFCVTFFFSHRRRRGAKNWAQWHRLCKRGKNRASITTRDQNPRKDQRFTFFLKSFRKLRQRH